MGEHKGEIGLLIEELRALHGEPESVVLWKVPHESFASYRALGMGEARSYEEYAMWLRHMVVALEARGQRVQFFEGTPEEVVLAREELPNTSENRARAFAALHAERASKQGQ